MSIDMESRTAGPSRTSAHEFVPSFATESCGRTHVATTPSRRLCVSRRARSSRLRVPSTLEVHVSSCVVHPSSVDPAPALVTVSGSLTGETIDDTVRQSALDFARFARNVVIDMSGVESIDHHGAALIGQMGALLVSIDGRLSIHDPNVVVEHVLLLCGIGDPIGFCHPS